MRIWDLPANRLCRKHLLGEHRELHAIWTIITDNRNGYRNHPETKRWVGKLAALYKRHDEQVREMTKRNYKHHSPLNMGVAVGRDHQEEFINTLEEQEEIIKRKHCECFA